MPLLFWLDMAALGYCALIGASLFATTLGAGTRSLQSASFAVFTALMSAWAVIALALKFTLWLGVGDPVLWGELSVLSFSLLGPAVLAFAARYVQVRRGPPTWPSWPAWSSRRRWRFRCSATVS